MFGKKNGVFLFNILDFLSMKCPHLSNIFLNIDFNAKEKYFFNFVA
jgi:hypothetical protein